ncbi:polyphosphate:AMP phosphotransferase [Ruminococcus sp. YE71]|uniref:polyphosphate:AMP phosphotransferase n=1 Tax=unclassified Ruminococcus TaxID=2608920 RepID=UPI000888F8E2|nr:MULTISPECIES: polyphosphate:AMP phosphotransferase [unclassified Ruminococcus]SDA16281.1 polyphosphate:AMP phosphotransferase [Ruminococcus sp. YE78]SFW24436.1 polyphosphate:AMP phosphotransferase [Ruminococcus sp. YE71]
MLEQIEQRKTKKTEAADELNAMREELIDLANAAKASKLPVIITIDGWSAAGKGSQIAKLIKYMDPRFYDVESIRTPSAEEKRMPWLHRYWRRLPKQGEFLILDGSWYHDTVKPLVYGDIDKDTYKERLDDINVLERQLTDDGYLLIKLFLHITCDEQKKRIERLAANPYTAWRVDEQDFADNKIYDKFFKRYDKTLTRTNTEYAPWHIIPSNDKTTAQFEIMRIVTNAVKGAVTAKAAGTKYAETPEFTPCDVKPEKFRLVKTKKLADTDMDKSLTDKEYGEKLNKYQDRLFELQNICYQRKIPVVICYEGWDAGGKGGNIKRVAAALDPRGYEVKPIAAPEPSELARHYLWRFWNRLEKDGHFTIFDRTWYGRVMVEVLEHLTPETRTEMAYQEINEFEKMLTEWGAVVIKFWINIDKDEQLRRFTERQNTPSKQWKITDEDWRNREKWDEYEKAVDKMIELTSTDFAPWTVIEGNDKKYARVKALKTICRALEERIR